MSTRFAIAIAGIACLACSAPAEETRTLEQALPSIIDVRRSLAVTEQSILARFTFERVMNQLVVQSDVDDLTATGLFQQLWDTQNPGPGTYAGAHCDDELDPVRGTLLNDFPYVCRGAPSEGAQVDCDPFSEASDCAYIPIGLFNRFDMAPEDGSHCGEYRVVFAKESGVLNRNERNLMIFEAVLPNPIPQLGLKGCQNVVKTWAKLSHEPHLEKRADELEAFYFDGAGLVPPALHIDHLGAGPTAAGQIRTNQFIFADGDSTNLGWMLREFKLAKDCDDDGCSSLSFEPVTTKVNASGELFDPASTHTQADAFRADFPNRVDSLLATSVSGISWTVPDSFNTGQSASSGPFAPELDYNAYLGTSTSPLRSAVEAKLLAIGSSLTVENVLDRARTQTCAGCHRRSRDVDLGDGLTWPADLGFVHVSERVTETVDGEIRFDISDALEDEFLPTRRKIMEDFLDDKPRPPAADPSTPLAGHRHHG